MRYSFKRALTSFAVLTGLGLLLGFIIATPGMAATAGNPTGNVAASASISSSITLSLSATSFNFGSGSPGTVLGSLTTPAYAATVTTNDLNGWTLTQADTGFTDGHGDTIPDSDLMVSTLTNGNLPWSTPAEWSGPSPVTIASMANPGILSGNSVGIAQQLTLPNEPAGNYTDTLLYTAVAS